MKHVRVRVVKEFDLMYDPESQLFKETLSDYKDCINRKATEKDMILDVANQLTLRGGANSMLEGIGYVRVVNQKTPSAYSGIDVADDDPSNFCEIIK